MGIFNPKFPRFLVIFESFNYPVIKIIKQSKRTLQCIKQSKCMANQALWIISFLKLVLSFWGGSRGG